MLSGVAWKRVGDINIGDGLASFKIDTLKDGAFQPGGMMKSHSLYRARALRDILGPEQVARNHKRREAAMKEAMMSAA